MPSLPVVRAFVKPGRCVPLVLNSIQKCTIDLPSGALLFQGKRTRTRNLMERNKEPNMCKMYMIVSMLRFVILLVQYLVLAVMSHS